MGLNQIQPIHNRVAGLLLKNEKVLLVTGYEEVVYWTPGGKKELDESDEVTLARELTEELGIKMLKANFFVEYSHPTRGGKPAITRAYIVDWEREISPQQEITKVRWFGKAEFENDKPLISKGAKESLFPKLIKEGLIT